MKAMTVSNAFFRRFLAAVAAGTMLSTAYVPVTVAQTTAPAAVGLPDFTAIVEKADPAVVNIRTTATVPVRGGNGPGGSDPYELFRWFFGPEFQPPGQSPNPRQRPQPTPPEERTVPRGVKLLNSASITRRIRRLHQSSSQRSSVTRRECC